MFCFQPAYRALAPMNDHHKKHNYSLGSLVHCNAQFVALKRDLDGHYIPAPWLYLIRVIIIIMISTLAGAHTQWTLFAIPRPINVQDMFHTAVIQSLSYIIVSRNVSPVSKMHSTLRCLSQIIPTFFTDTTQPHWGWIKMLSGLSISIQLLRNLSLFPDQELSTVLLTLFNALFYKAFRGKVGVASATPCHGHYTHYTDPVYI